MIKAIFKNVAAAFRTPHDGRTVHPSRTCTECGSALFATDDATWLCPNPDCPAQVRSHLEHWCSAEVMDIPGANTKLVAQLVQIGLARDVAELYLLKIGEAE